MTDEKSNALEPAMSALEALEAAGGSLGDFDGTEAGIPRISIKGDIAQWSDSLTGLMVPTFTGIFCGIVKQRILWPPEVGEEKADPLCKSMDGQTARPNAKTFPIKESGFEGLVLTDDVVITLDCGACKLKDWESHPTRSGPWCTEQITAIVMADLEDSGTFMPALMSFQRSSLKPIRSYLAGFKRSQAHPFSVVTKFDLEAKRRGNVKYAVPVFSRGDATDREMWEVAASNYIQLSEYVTRWRDERSDDGDITVHVDDELPEF